MAQHHTHPTADTAKGRGLVKFYCLGFILSLILTLAAFYVVEHRSFDTRMLYGAITLFALLQLLVQVICFLRLNARTEHDRWNLICFLFTLLIIAIIVVGSLWIMYNLNYNMVN